MSGEWGFINEITFRGRDKVLYLDRGVEFE